MAPATKYLGVKPPYTSSKKKYPYILWITPITVPAIVIIPSSLGQAFFRGSISHPYLRMIYLNKCEISKPETTCTKGLANPPRPTIHKAISNNPHPII